MAPRPQDVSVDQRPQNRLYELDVLRGIAALGVVACHYCYACRTVGRLDFDFRLGSYGPHLFFIISGFVILLSAQRYKRPADFAFFRFARLYPVYWFAVTCSTAILLLIPREVADRPTTWQFLGNLTMLQTWLRIPDIETAYWTLGVELKFYFLVLLLLCFRQLQRCDWFVVGWLSAVVVYRCADAWVDLPHALATPLILDYAHLFAAGIMFFGIRSHGHSVLRHGVILLAVPLQLWATDVETTVVVSCFLVVFYLFVFGKLTWTVNRPLCFLGKISYPLYLIHGSIGIALVNGLAANNFHLVWLFVIPTLVSGIGATLLTYYLERPSLHWLRARYQSGGPSLVANLWALPKA